MQVSPPGCAMRATLHAANMLMQWRGLTPLANKHCDIDIAAWVQRRETIEELDDDLFESTAYIFVAETIDHRHRDAFLSRTADVRKAAAKKKAARKRGKKRNQDEEHEDDEGDGDASDDGEAIQTPEGQFVVRTHANRYELKKLICDATQFVSQLYPLCFSCSVPQEQRPHIGLEYRHAMIVHAGFSMKEFNLRLRRIVQDVDEFRKKCVAVEKLAPESVEKLPVRLFFIVWGAAFNPRTGSQFKVLQRSVRKFNISQAENSTGISIEAHSVVELQFDVTQHEHAGAYTVVNPATIPALRTIALHQFRYLHDTDPQARVRDLRVGQVVRIDRANASVEYVVVVPYDSVIAADGGDEGDEDAPAAPAKKVPAVQQGAE